MNKPIGRRGFMRLLPMAPALAKQIAGEISTGTAAKAAQMVGGGMPMGQMISASGGLSSAPYRLAHESIMEQVTRGLIPDHKDYEYRSTAKHQARWRLDEDVEALGSISAGHRRRMHERSAYRSIVRTDIEEHRNASLWRKLYAKFGATE